jgi:hypothetical protein
MISFSRKKNFVPYDFTYICCTKYSGLESQKKNHHEVHSYFQNTNSDIFITTKFRRSIANHCSAEHLHMPTKSACTLQPIYIRWLSTFSFSQTTAMTAEWSYQLTYTHKTKQYLPKLRNIMALLFCVYAHAYLTSEAKHWHTEKFFWFLPSFM